MERCRKMADVRKKAGILERLRIAALFLPLILVVGLFHVVLLGLIIYFRPDIRMSMDALEEHFQDGELFFFSVALLGGAIYSVLANRHLVPGLVWGLIAVAAFVVWAITNDVYLLDMVDYLRGGPHGVPHRLYFLMEIICLGIASAGAFLVAVVYDVHAPAEKEERDAPVTVETTAG
jgi:hypothetical protein